MRKRHSRFRTLLQLGLILLSVAAISVQASERKPRTTNDHRINFKKAAAEVAIFKTWVIGANRPGLVDAVLSQTSPVVSRYSIKGLDNKRLLQYERQGKFGGINLGWIKNASAKTAKKKSYWILVPRDKSKREKGKDLGKAIRSTPIRYGETIAIGRQPKPRNIDSDGLVNAWRFLKYGKRKKALTSTGGTSDCETRDRVTRESLKTKKGW